MVYRLEGKGPTILNMITERFDTARGAVFRRDSLMQLCSDIKVFDEVGQISLATLRERAGTEP